jgi:hypothetical protein
VSGWPRGHRYTPSCAVERKPSPRDADEPPDAAGLHAVAVGYFARLGFELITFRHEPVAPRSRRTARRTRVPARPRAADAARTLPVAIDAPAPILEVKPADLEASRIAAQLEVGHGAHVGRQLGSRDRLIARIAAQRCFAVVLSGEVSPAASSTAAPPAFSTPPSYLGSAHPYDARVVRGMLTPIRFSRPRI